MYISVGGIMKKESRVGIAFLSLIALLLCAGIGFYLVDNKVKLSSANGLTDEKWCVKLIDLSEPKLKGDAFSNNYSIEATSLSFGMKLTSPLDEINYNVKVKNCGTVDAYLYSIDLTEYEDKDALLYIVKGIEQGDTLKSDEVVPISVQVSSNDGELKEGKLKLNFYFSQER